MPDKTKLPKISFSTFIMSLHSSALLALGLIEDPVTKQRTKNIAMAKQTIDVIGIIEEKTKGNLTKEENELIQNALQNLRMEYVKETN